MAKIEVVDLGEVVQELSTWCIVRFVTKAGHQYEVALCDDGLLVRETSGLGRLAVLPTVANQVEIRTSQV